MQTELNLRQAAFTRNPIADLANSKAPVHIIFGNHGTGVQLEDYFDLLEGVLAEAKVPFFFSKSPVAGSTNIMIECFDDEFANEVEALAKTSPDTRFVCICTEFLTGTTFNEFSPDLSKKLDQTRRSERRLRILRNPVMLPILRWGYHMAPKVAESIVQVVLPQKNQQKRGWLRRYRSFVKIQSYCQNLWCISPHQIQAYKARFGDEKVQYLPIVSFSNETRLRHSDAKKDVDFLFSGSMTPYRAAVIARLRELGYKVEVGFWHSRIRDHLLERSKICLHIRQDSQWAYPSIMRYHKLLSSGNLVVAESCPEKCDQDNYTRQCSIDNFVESCVQEYESGRFSERGEKMARRYYNDLAALRKQAVETLLKTIS